MVFTRSPEIQVAKGMAVMLVYPTQESDSGEQMCISLIQSNQSNLVYSNLILSYPIQYFYANFFIWDRNFGH